MIKLEAQLVKYKHEYKELMGSFESQTQRLQCAELELNYFKDKKDRMEKVTCQRFQEHHRLTTEKETNSRLLTNSAKKVKKQNWRTDTFFDDSANNSSGIKHLRRTDSSFEVYDVPSLQTEYTDFLLAVNCLLTKTNDNLVYENRRLSGQLDATKFTEEDNNDLHLQLQCTKHTLNETREELIYTQQKVYHSAPTLTEQVTDDMQMNAEYLEEENGTLKKAIFELEAQLVKYKHEHKELLGVFESQTHRFKSAELELYKDKLAKLADDKRKKTDIILSLQRTIYKLEQCSLWNGNNAAKQIEDSASAKSAIKDKYIDKIYEIQHANGKLLTDLQTRNDEYDKLKENFENEQRKSMAKSEIQLQKLKTTEMELESCKKRLREISEDEVHKNCMLEELRTRLANVEQLYKATMQTLRSEKSNLVSEYDAEISEFKQKSNDLRKRVDHLSKQNDTLKDLIKQNDKRVLNEMEELKKRLRSTEMEQMDTKTKLQKEDHSSKPEYERYNANLQLEKHKLEVCNADLESQNDQMKKDIVILKNGHESDRNALKKQLHRKEEELKETQLEIQNSKKRYSEDEENMNKEIAALRSKLAYAEETLLQMKREAQQTIHAAKHDTIDADTRYRNELSRLQQRNIDLERHLDKLLRENEKFKTDNERQRQAYSKDEVNMNNEISGLRSKLNDADATLLQMKKKASETMHAAKNKNIEGDTKYRNELSRLQQSNIVMERLIEAYKTKSIETASQLANMERSGQTVKKELDETRTRLLKISVSEEYKDKQIVELRARLLDEEKALQQTCEYDKEQITTLENKTSKLASEYSNEVYKLKQKTSDLNKHVEELTKENDTLRDLSKQTEKQSSDNIDSLTKRLQCTELEQIDTIKRLRQEEHSSKALYETNISGLQLEKHKLEESKGYLQSENEQMKKYINKLKNRLDSGYGDLQNQLQQKKNALKDTELELENATTSFKRLSEEEVNMKNEIAGLRANLAEVQATLQQMTRGAEERIRALENEKSDTDAQYNADLTRCQQHKIHLEKQVEQLRRENEECKTDIDRQKQTIEEMSMETNSKFQNMERNCQKSKEELNEAMKIMRKISEDNVHKNNKIVILKTSLANVEQTFQQTSKDAIEKTKQIESEKSRVAAEYSNEVSKLKQKTSDLRKHVEELTKENETLRNLSKQNEKQSSYKIETLRKRLQSTEMELSDTRTKLQKEEHSSKAMYETKITSLQQENEKLEESKAYLDNENDQKKKYIDKLKNILDSDYGDLQKQLHEKENELKETELELDNATTRFSEEEVNMKNEIEDLQANLAEVQATLQQTKRDAEERILVFENKKSDTNAQYNAELTRFQQNEIRLEKHVEQLLKENEKCKTDINRQNQTFENMLIETNSRFENMERNCQKYKNELDETRSRMREISKDNARKNSEIENLQTSLANVEQKFQQTRREAKGKTKQIESEKSNWVSEHNKEVSSLHQNINDMKRHIADLSTENDKLKSYNKQHEKLSSNDIDTLKQRVQSTEMDLLDARKKLQKEKEKHNSQAMYETTITNLREEKRKLEICKADLETKNGQMKRDIINLENRLGSYQKSARYSDSDYDVLQKNFRRREKELKDTELQLEDTKTRLGKCMQHKQVNSNPNIADLSDIHRPTRLADRFQELYDDRWTDAFETLEESNICEKDIIRILLTIVTQTKHFCDGQSEQQIEDINKAITQYDEVRQQGIPDNVMKYIKDFRKDSFAEISDNVYKKYQRWLQSDAVAIKKYVVELEDYTKECFELCWLIAIQDQRIVFSPEPKHDDTFQSDVYKLYTVQGTMVDFLVWPALRLHENGPLLSKGVVQAQIPSGGEVGGRIKETT